MEHEIVGEALDVSLDRSVEGSGFHSIKQGKVGIEQHFFATDKENKLREVFRLGSNFCLCGSVLCGDDLLDHCI